MLKTRKKQPWYANGLQFRCTMCGNCCSGPGGEIRVSPGECRRLAKSLGLSRNEFKESYTEVAQDGGGIVLKMKPTPGVKKSEDCIFLDRKSIPGRAVCTVHESKPQQCVSWPFWPASLHSAESWKAAGEICPGVRVGGPVYTPKKIDQIRDSMKGLEKSIGPFEQGWT